MPTENDPFRENETESNRTKKLELLRDAVVALQEEGLTPANLVAALLAIDTPHSAGQVLTINAGNNGLEWTTPT